MDTTTATGSKTMIKRLYPGMYFGTVATTVDGKAANVDVRIMRNTEWSGCEKWSLEIHIADDWTCVVEKSDNPTRTYTECRADAARMLAEGLTR